MFKEASSFVEGVDFTFALIFGISLFFLVGITVVMIYFVVKYHHKKNPKATDIEGNFSLEVLWTVIPTILVMVMFYFGWSGYKQMRIVPKDAIVVEATGRMWSWSFKYENGKVSDTLVVPINKAVKLDLMSDDVIHSLFIPAFRVKEDLIPGDTNYLWFEAREIGSYHILCAEYCGDRHAYMVSKVDVLPMDMYEEWYNTKIDTSNKLLMGENLLKSNACLSCHSIDGSRLVGPSFKGFFDGEAEVIENGEEKTVEKDIEYFKNSVTDPDMQVVKGFNAGMMVPYPDKFTEEDYSNMIEYIKSLDEE
jgi:cytochrome c oxidase subunit 2